jgi:hypothetical protein
VGVEEPRQALQGAEPGFFLCQLRMQAPPRLAQVQRQRDVVKVALRSCAAS